MQTSYILIPNQRINIETGSSEEKLGVVWNSISKAQT